MSVCPLVPFNPFAGVETYKVVESLNLWEMIAFATGKLGSNLEIKMSTVRVTDKFRISKIQDGGRTLMGRGLSSRAIGVAAYVVVDSWRYHQCVQLVC